MMKNCHSKPKYGNKKVSGYDSLKERNRAATLKMCVNAGIIEALQEQVRFELIPAQYKVIDGKRKCVERSCSYIADFTYYREGQFIVEDAKGMRTKEYVIKRKLMRHVHGIEILET